MQNLEEVVNKGNNLGLQNSSPQYRSLLKRAFRFVNPAYPLRNVATYLFIKLGELKNYFFNS